MDHSTNAANIFNICAEDYQNKYMAVDLYHDTLDLFCDSIKFTGASILDVACGPGNMTKYLLKKRPDFKILGIDLSPNMLELAKINNPTAEFQLMDCRNIGMIEMKYDGIMSGFCLPYLSKAEAATFISDASKLLTEKGILYISTMEDDYSKSGFKSSSSGEHQMYIHFHQADYLTQALEQNDFKIVTLKRQDYPTNDAAQTTDLIIIAQKHK